MLKSLVGKTDNKKSLNFYKIKNYNNNMNFNFFPSADITWWDPTNPEDKRSFIYQKQLNWVNNNLKVDLKGEALDIGSGRGRYTRLGLNKGYDVTSIDVNPKMLKQMEKIGLKNKKLVMGGENLKFKKNSFDIVFAMEVIMHIKDIEKFLSEVYRVLRPGGIAFLNITNRQSLYPLWVTKINPVMSSDQKKYPRIQYKPQEFETYIKNAKFNLSSQSGFGVVPPLSIKHRWKGTILPKWIAIILSAALDPRYGYNYGFCVNYVVKKKR